MSNSNRAGELLAVKKATVEADFYNIRTASGELHDGWEQVLSLLEGHAAPVLRAIVGDSGWPLASRDRERLVNWIAAQYLRTPYFRFQLDLSLENARAAAVAGGVEAIRAMADRPDLSDAELLEAWSKADGYYPRGAYQDANTQLRWFRDLLPETAKALYERPWNLVTFDEPSLLTADNAVVPIGDGDDEMHPLAPGAPVVNLALDRTHLLVLGIPGNAPDVQQSGTAEHAFMVNAMAIHHASKLVLQHPDDDFANELWDVPETP